MLDQKKMAPALLGLILLLVAGIVGLVNRSAFDLPDDLDESHTLTGETTFVNRDHFFPYELAFNPVYNGTGASTLNSTYTTQRELSIKSAGDEDDFNIYDYNNTVVKQPTFLIDVNGGGVEGGIAEVDFGNGPMTFPFEPYQSHLTRMYLNKEDWHYQESEYTDNHTGFARSVMTHHLEKRDYRLYVGNLKEALPAIYDGTRDIQGLEGYAYRLEYTWTMPFPVYATNTTTAFLTLNEISVEVHEPTLGILLAQSDVINYTLTVYCQ